MRSSKGAPTCAHTTHSETHACYAPTVAKAVLLLDPDHAWPYSAYLGKFLLLCGLSNVCVVGGWVGVGVRLSDDMIV